MPKYHITTEQLNELKVQYSLTHHDLARLAMTTDRTVRSWLYGERQCSGANAALIMLRLGEISLHSLTRGDFDDTQTET